jgi:ribonucleoside-diphosphate reductase alpha chain
VASILNQCLKSVKADDAELLLTLANQAFDIFLSGIRPEVTEVRPEVLECDVVRFQNNREKWVALVGLLNGYPYEIFTGLADDEDGIVLPKTVTTGKIIKQVNPDGTKRYDFQFENRRGYKTTVEGLSEKFNPEYWNYAKLISGVLRYRMPIEHVIKLVASLSLKDESINTWKTGVERALKKYAPGCHDEEEEEISE